MAKIFFTDFTYPRFLSRGLFLYCLWSVGIMFAMDLNYCDLDIYDGNGSPLLCNAIKDIHCGDLYINLLKRGAWVNIKDLYGNTPLFYAARAGDDNKIEKLLSYGAAANRMMYEQLSTSKELLMRKLFLEQTCYVCNTHDFDLDNISCINRHLGNFICVCCYTVMCYDNKTKCPICSRTLGKFGF